MTLGGLALAVGILVDDATVAIENINRNLEQGKELEPAILDGAAADRGPGVRLDALHLHRVRADVLPHRRRALPVRAAGRGGRVRDARVVRPVAHAGADDGEVPAAARTSAHGDGGRAAIRSCASQRALRARLRAAARRLSRALLEQCVDAARRLRRAVPRRLRRVARSLAAAGSARTSSRRSTPASSSCTCARRPARASRRPRALCDRVEAVDPRGDPARRARSDHRQHRPAVQRHQPLVQQLGADRAGRRRHPRVARRGPPADRGVRPRAAACGCRSEFPGVTFSFLPADIVTPDPELRPAGADRRPGRRPQPRGEPRGSRPSSSTQAARRCPASSTCACTSRSTSRGCTWTSTARARRRLGFTQRDVANNLLISLSRQRADRRRPSG